MRSGGISGPPCTVRAASTMPASATTPRPVKRSDARRSARPVAYRSRAAPTGSSASSPWVVGAAVDVTSHHGRLADSGPPSSLGRGIRLLSPGTPHRGMARPTGLEHGAAHAAAHSPCVRTRCDRHCLGSGNNTRQRRTPSELRRDLAGFTSILTYRRHCDNAFA